MQRLSSPQMTGLTSGSMQELEAAPQLHTASDIPSPNFKSIVVDKTTRLRGGAPDTATPQKSPTIASRLRGGRDEGGPEFPVPSPGTRRKGKEVSIAEGSPEIIGSPKSILEYHARLAQRMEGRGLATTASSIPDSPINARMSPVRDDSGTASTPFDLPTTSTESNQTVRGGMTPGPVARTPSYPFPRMTASSFRPSSLHHVSGQQPQTASTHSPFGSLTQYDQLRSDPSTPVSGMTFLPAGAGPYSESFDFPTPNLYSMSLMLSAEPGLDAWWNSVVQIMTDVYKAERVTLSVPADSTDIDNVPWGQKATFNSREGDDLSIGYIGRGSSLVTTAPDDQSDLSSNLGTTLGTEKYFRPGVPSRHSFTTYEEEKESRNLVTNEEISSSSRRPGLTPRSKSLYPGASRHSSGVSHPALNKKALEEHDAVLEQQDMPNWEATFDSGNEAKGRLLPVLQGLDLEADPLIDHNGITRVIERGKVIALTRTYPYLDLREEERQKSRLASAKSQELRKTQRGPSKPDAGTKLSSLLANASVPRSATQTQRNPPTDKTKFSSLLSVMDDALPRPPTPKYEEYEQAPPSPWSQSPAPSPAVRTDGAENPFFTDAMVDEESFNPDSGPHDYSSTRPPETIGVDNSWTVLHIPLNHPLLSKPTQGFKLDSSILQRKSTLRGARIQGATPKRSPSPDFSQTTRQAPIAILSILSPVIPYPSNLRYSLEHLAPHLATTFSLGRHYSNLETEAVGLQRKRPSSSTIGFGAISHDGRPIADPPILAQLDYTPSEEVSQASIAGSMTSPSEYSGPARSTTNSPLGTPGWDSGSLGLVVERRPPGTSPNQVGDDNYFSTIPRSRGLTVEASPGPSSQRSSRAVKETVSTGRQSRLSGGVRISQPETSVASKDGSSLQLKESIPNETPSSPRSQQRPVSIASTGSKEPEETHPTGNVDERQHQRTTKAEPRQASHKHTKKLHSYGGEFAATFQSLPPSTTLLTKPTANVSAQPRVGSVPAPQVSMRPPTERLKSLMLDTLPVQVFVAWPVTGEIVWVNSRYLSYRGQTLADLVSDPWGSLHPEDLGDYVKAWTHSLRTGEPFGHTVRLRRFDGAYRWHQARAVASKDKRGVIVQFMGSYMDIHDQKVAEAMALHQKEIEASEAKHRLLANLIPQIIFTATENEGITFANEQWLSYTGQSDDSAFGLGFIESVHPDDLAKCRLPMTSATRTTESNSISESSDSTTLPTPMPREKGLPGTLSRTHSAASSVNEFPSADLSELAKKGIVKVAKDSSGRLSYTTEVRLRSKTGEYRWHLIRCVETGDVGFRSDSSSNSYFGSATDINDHKLLEEKLKEAMESKGRFLSNMSHEIRTPLIGISGMVSFLQDTTLNEEQRDYTNTIQTSANSLLMIINDILDLSKVDAGMMKLNFEWFHTRSLIEDVNELVSTMAIAKRLELNYIIDENVPSWVKGDKIRIRQVLLNVVGNAIKFTTEGEVFSQCRVISDDTHELGENQIMLEFAIIDTGRGFTEEEAELIFKPFSQIDGSSTRQHGGSGLGLVISRQLVELHGGRMEGTAVPGKGSTFKFTARFGLPDLADHPTAISTPPLMASMRTPLEDKGIHNFRPLALQRMLDQPLTASPGSDAEVVSPALASSASSDPSVRSARTQTTSRSSASSVVGLVHFGEAAKASGQDFSQMKLEMPTRKGSPRIAPRDDGSATAQSSLQFRPPMYSILIICSQQHSRAATTKHIEMTLPKDIPHQITSVATLAEAEKLISGHESVTFTHVVLNLSAATEIVNVIDQIISTSGGKICVLVLTDSVQRQAVLKLASDAIHQQLLADKRVIFVYKPVKPSRFAIIFDPAHERDLSVDLNRSNAAQVVETQRQNYVEVEKRIGNKGYKILLVEDNPVNQKVLVRYLKKVGIKAEIATDGVEATQTVFSHPVNHYSLILCDLHMPRKDGYQTCREIRDWERKNNYSKIPIVALSANVMSDVQEKCASAGFDDYVTKPVDFVDLSNVMSKFIQA